MKNSIHIATEFSEYPAGRYKTDGPYPGETFRRKHLVPMLRQGGAITVNLDGTLGYGSSFLEEAFGGLVRHEGFSQAELRKRLIIESKDSARLKEIWGYIDEAVPEGGSTPQGASSAS